MPDPRFVRRQANELADRLLDDLFAGRLEKVGLGEVQVAATFIAPPDRRIDYYDILVDWTIEALVRKAAR